MDQLKRRQQGILSEALLANKAYIDAEAYVQASQLRGQDWRACQRYVTPFSNDYTDALNAVQRPAQGQRERQHEANEIRRQINAGVKPYALPTLGPLNVAIDDARIAWEEQRRENALKSNPDEWRMIQSTQYFRYYYSVRSYTLARAMADTNIGTPTTDALDQAFAALEQQQKWLLTTDDWLTRNREEKDFEQKNPLVKRWLRRVKPYRYANEEGDSHE